MLLTSENFCSFTNNCSFSFTLVGNFYRITNSCSFSFLSYFAVPYPLPKLDMVAIPDFAAGAMENYGLVTYRETALLYDDHLSSASNKQSVISP